MRLLLFFNFLFLLNIVISAREALYSVPPDANDGDGELNKLFESGFTNSSSEEVVKLLGLDGDIHDILKNADVETNKTSARSTEFSEFLKHESEEYWKKFRGNRSAVSIEKRLFRKARGSSGVGTIKSVLSKVGASVKKGAKRVIEFLKGIFTKMKQTFMKIKEKVKKAVSRTKAVFKKVTNHKGFVFVKETATCVWKQMPESVKDIMMDKAVDIAFGAEGDITAGLEAIDFDPDSLLDDDELAFDLDEMDDDDSEIGEKSNLDKLEEEWEIQEKEDEEENGDYDSEEELFSGSELQVIRGKHEDLVSSEKNSRKPHEHQCCCVSYKGEDVSPEEVPDDKLEDIDPASLELTSDLDDFDFDPDHLLPAEEGAQHRGLFDIHMEDFTEEGLAKEKDDLVNLNAFPDLSSEQELSDAETDALAEELVSKRSIKKRCPCTHKGQAIRERAIGLVARKHKIRQMPPLTSSLPVEGAVAMLKQGGIIVDNLCQTETQTNCVNLKGIRMGSVASLLSTKLLCPLCQIKLLDGGEKQQNIFLKGWSFLIEQNEELNVFLGEAYKTYSGQAELFDPNKNMWGVKQLDPNNEDNWAWEVTMHL